SPDVDNQRRSIKVRGGIRKGRKSGRWARKPLFGYISAWDEEQKHTIVPDPQKAWVVQTIFEQVAEGIPQREIIRELQKKGVTVSRNNISLILRREVYMGKIVIPANEHEPETIRDGI